MDGGEERWMEGREGGWREGKGRWMEGREGGGTEEERWERYIYSKYNNNYVLCTKSMQYCSGGKVSWCYGVKFRSFCAHVVD